MFKICFTFLEDSFVNKDRLRHELKLITICQQLVDDVFLLGFLRARKYSMDDAYHTFEQSWLAKKRYPLFFDVGDAEIEKAWKLFDTGCVVPLSERDALGRRIIFFRTKYISTDEYQTSDAMRVFAFIIMTLMEEEETQIAGIICVFDHEEITLKHIMTPMDVRDFMDFVKNCASVRQKANYVVNLPTFANVMIELFKAALSEKLKSRVFILKNNEELINVIDKAILPKEYGGIKTVEEMLNDFRKLRDSKKHLTEMCLKTPIPWEKVPVEKLKGDTEAVGSFRKLEVD